MSELNGRFIWHELLTCHVEDATQLYAAIFNWTVRETPIGGITYTIFETDLGPVAAVISPSAEAEEPHLQGWISYIGVEDLDAAAASVVRLGGTVLEAATDTKDIGRFAIVADPDGAPVGLFTPTPENPGRNERAADAVGHVSWHELYANDVGASFDFYAKVFGWSAGPYLDMGPAGPYQIVLSGGRPMGGIMRKPATIAANAWNPFVQVSDIQGAQQRLSQSGATVIDGPRKVPDGGWTLKCHDAQGSIFAVVGPQIDQ